MAGPLSGDVAVGRLDHSDLDAEPAAVAPGADDAWIEEFFEFDDQVGREDKVLVESVHRGMRSGAVDRGRLMLASEQLIAAFDSWVAARLA